MDASSQLVYIMTFILCIFFSSLAIFLRRAEWAFMSTITWFSLALLTVGVVTEEMFLPLAWLFFANGFVFVLLGFYYVFDSYRFKKRQDEERQLYEVD